jgi:hypothetical protein
MRIGTCVVKVLAACCLLCFSAPSWCAGPLLEDEFDGNSLDWTTWLLGDMKGAAMKIGGGELVMRPPGAPWATASIVAREPFDAGGQDGITLEARIAGWAIDLADDPNPEAAWIGIGLKEAPDGVMHYFTSKASILLTVWVADADPTHLRVSLLAKGEDLPMVNGEELLSRRLVVDKFPVMMRLWLNASDYQVEFANAHVPPHNDLQGGSESGKHGLDIAKWAEKGTVSLIMANAADAQTQVSFTRVAVYAGRVPAEEQEPESSVSKP